MPNAKSKHNLKFVTKTIKPNLTIGQRLKRSREQKGITIEQAEAETLVRAKYLIALEQDNWRVIPGQVYLQGYLRRYGDYLGFDGNGLVKKFIGEFSNWSNNKTNLEKTPQKIKSAFAITPKLIAGVLVTIIVLTMTGYIGYQIHQVTASPSLVIIAPGQEVVVSSDQLEIIGKTSAGAVVFINSQNVSQDLDGNFKQEIGLQDGLNTIEIVAKSRFNRQTSKIIKVLKSQTNG